MTTIINLHKEPIMHEYLQQLTLGAGDGELGTAACWVRSLELHQTGQRALLGGSVVDPVALQLCVHINDAYGRAATQRTADILEFGYFRPLGAVTDEHSKQRVWHLADAVIRRWLPYTLRDARVMYAPIRTNLENWPRIENVDGAYALVQNLTGYRNFFGKVAAEYEYFLGSTIGMLLGMCVPTTPAAQALLLLSPVVRICTRSSFLTVHHQFIKQMMFPTLAEILEIGKVSVAIPDEPVNGVDAFLEACGVGYVPADA